MGKRRSTAAAVAVVVAGAFGKAAHRHTFTAEELGIDEELAPGADRMLDVVLRDIPVGYICRFHADQGMRGAFSFEDS